jgi:hypothetical protein
MPQARPHTDDQEITSLGYPDSAFAILSTYPPTRLRRWSRIYLSQAA